MYKDSCCIRRYTYIDFIYIIRKLMKTKFVCENVLKIKLIENKIIKKSCWKWWIEILRPREGLTKTFLKNMKTIFHVFSSRGIFRYNSFSMPLQYYTSPISIYSVPSLNKFYSPLHWLGSSLSSKQSDWPSQYLDADMQVPLEHFHSDILHDLVLSDFVTAA